MFGGVLAAGAIVLLVCESVAFADTSTAAAGRSIIFRLGLEPRTFGTAFPGHPTASGQKQIGVIGRATFDWSADPRVSLEAGILARLPFALDLSDEAGALPVFALTLRPLGRAPAPDAPALLLRMGSLDIHHGYHPAIVDEARYAYGRPYLENYNRSLVPEARRNFSKDPFMPAEHGAQLIASAGGARIEGFLDWQLLETDKHREKFAVGLLGRLDTRWVDLLLQFRLVHYGGQLYTKSDPVRFMNLDPVRQPITTAIVLVPRPVVVGGDTLVLELPVSYVRGRIAQGPGEEPSVQSGFEIGADARVLGAGRLGYRYWAPVTRDFGFLSEDGDPVYAGRRSHRAIAELAMRIGAVVLSGRLDLIFPAGFSEVEYETLGVASFNFERRLWPAAGGG